MREWGPATRASPASSAVELRPPSKVRRPLLGADPGAPRVGSAGTEPARRLPGTRAPPAARSRRLPAPCPFPLLRPTPAPSPLPGLPARAGCARPQDLGGPGEGPLPPAGGFRDGCGTRAASWPEGARPQGRPSEPLLSLLRVCPGDALAEHGPRRP